MTFGVQPSSATAPDARAFFSYQVSPGAALVDHVAVLNYSLKPLTLSMYATDATNLADGAFGLAAASTTRRDGGAWITLPGSASTVTLPARADLHAAPVKRIVPVSVQVPADATPGDHSAGIVAVLSSSSASSEGSKVRLDQRVGARVFFRVSGELHPKLAVEHLTVSYQGTTTPEGAGTATVHYTVHNRGNVKLGARQVVTTSGWFGTASDRSRGADIALLLPGNKVDVTVHVHGVRPALRSNAVVELTPVRPQTDTDPDLPVVRTGSGFWTVPWTALGLLGLLVVGLVFAVRRRRVAA